MSHYKTLKPTYGKLTIMFFSVVGTLYVAGSVVRTGKFIRDIFNSDSLLNPCPLVGCVYASDEVKKLPEVVYGVHGGITNEEIDKVIKQIEEKKTKQKAYKKDIEKTIKEVFGKNSTRALSVAFCESSHNEKAKSKTSSAKGLFQIINGTWKYFKCEGDPLNAYDNSVCAKKIFNQYGWGSTASWAASAQCWRK